MQQFRIIANSIHEEFLNSKAKIQVFGGGFANGKTATACVKGIQLARDYPGSNGLIARATYPKLCDTILAEWKKWLPGDWVKSFTKSNDRPTYVLKNDTIVNFRYVQQQKRAGTSTSNLLSATYDWIIVDQFDDPEFVYKDLTDLLGRLRGGTKYVGSDPHMPLSGPRWLLCTLNPTRNWFYKDLVKPVLDYQTTGHVSDRLAEQLAKMELSEVNDFIHLVQGPTTANAHNLEEDYIRSLYATYSGVMADRYIKGDWGAFTGLVYAMFDDLTHMVPESEIRRWKFASKITQWLECFDFGIRTPTCYMLAFRDAEHNVVFVDGLKEKELSPEETVRRIKAIRKQWNVPEDTDKAIYADPSTFRRAGSEYRTIGKSIAEVFKGGGSVSPSHEATTTSRLASSRCEATSPLTLDTPTPSLTSHQPHSSTSTGIVSHSLRKRSLTTTSRRVRMRTVRMRSLSTAMITPWMLSSTVSLTCQRSRPSSPR
jgi:hypothetical protein